MRKIAERKNADGRSAVVWFDYANREYRVQFYDHRGVHMDASDVITDSRDDAMEEIEDEFSC